MEMHEYRCRNCGGQLEQIDNAKWRCPYCSTTFEDSSVSKHAQSMSEVFDAAKQETINNLRRNLYDATHAEFISTSAIHEVCKAIKQYLPDDFQASFYETAVGSNVKQIAKEIRKIDIDKNIDDIEGIIQFLIRSLESEYQLEVNNLIAKAYETRDPLKFEHYCTLLSAEAIKVDMGVYETRIPRDVFIAYSSKDMHLVEELVEELESQKFKCFVASRNLRHGKGAVENYNMALEEAMDNCKSFVFISSTNSRSLTCDALKVELAYIKRKDIEHAPAEFKNDYSSIPAQYKKPRVEYRIGTNEDKTAADSVTRDFFNGYERVYTPGEVAQRVMMQMINTPHAATAPQPQQVKQEQKKICVSCGAENSVNMKFCGECGKNEFVSSVSELIKYKKLQEEENQAQRDAEATKTKTAALAEAERAKKEALAEAKKAKKAAEEMAAKAEAAEQARINAEEKARSARTSKGTAATGNQSIPNAYAPKSKKGGLIIGIGIAIAVVIAIIIGVANAGGGKSSDGSGNNNESKEELSSIIGNDESTESGNSTQQSDKRANYPNLSFTEVGGGWSVSAKDGKAANIVGELVIPSVIEGKNVVEIPDGGFKNCSGVTSVTVPDTVKYIGTGAFSGCSSLREISIPFVGTSQSATESYKKIFGVIFGDTEYPGGIVAEQYCDFGLSGAKSYFIPAQLTKVTVTNAYGLGYGAFSRCANLVEINLNEEIYTIDKCAFMDCSSLVSIDLPNVTQISERAFQNCTSLESFTIGSKVTSIGELAFDSCTNLARINSDKDGLFIIEDHVKSIGKGAFRGCILIKEISIPFVGTSQSATESYNKIFGVIFGDTEYPGGIVTEQYCNFGLSGRKTYFIPAQLTKVTVTNALGLGYGAFNACSMLESITINTAAQSNIGEKAFENCPATVVFKDITDEE